MKHCFYCFLIVLFVLFPCIILHAQKTPLSKILIDASSYKKISPFIYGQNTLAYDPCYQKETKKCNNDGRYSNHGAGQWNPMRQEADSVLLQFSRKIHVKFIRFPGGCGTHIYNWKKTIGPLKKRPLFQFGIDEFLALCEKLHATPIITLSYFTGTDADLADLIEYLNQPINGENPHGGINWALVRKANGHPEPYNTTFFELGNEVWHGTHGNDLKRGVPSPQAYAKRFIACQKLFKAIDSNIKLGAVLRDFDSLQDGWNYDVAATLRDKMDFGILHIYPISYTENNDPISSEELFSIALASPLQVQHGLESLSRQLEELTGHSVPLMITEYNGGFKQNKPLPYRHSLGNALLNASLIQTFLKADSPIIGANYWQFVNSYWGALYNPLYLQHRGTYIRRPNFFIFELFREHFGNNLLKTSTSCPSYSSRSFGRVLAAQKHPDEKKQIGTKERTKRIVYPHDWNISYARQFFAFKSTVKVKRKSKILEINFPFKKNINFYHIGVTLPVNPQRKYRLSGKIKTEWPVSSSGIYLNVQDKRGWKKTQWAESTQQVTGNRDWSHIQVEFQPLSDSKAIHIMIRRMNGGGVANGKVWIKNVILQDIGPAKKNLPTPYLSTIASIDDSGKKVYLIVVNKNLKKSIKATIKIKKFGFKDTGKFFVLHVPMIDSTNENGKEDVKLTEGTFKVEDAQNSFGFTFLPCSVTAIEVTGHRL